MFRTVGKQGIGEGLGLSRLERTYLCKTGRHFFLGLELGLGFLCTGLVVFGWVGGVELGCWEVY